jgi:hypothetical protein
MQLNIEDFPEPDYPKTPTNSPGITLKLAPLRIKLSCIFNATFIKVIFPIYGQFSS